MMKNNTMKFFLFAALLSLVTALPSHFATKPGTVSAKALKMPGVKALEFLRGADPVMLKHCTDPDSLEECPDDILLQLELLGQHEGIAMLGDIMLVDFCARSPFADSLDICKERDAKIMLTHLHKYQDKEYRNKEMLACIRNDESCKPVVRTHLDNLLLMPETLVPIQYVMKFLCHNADFKSELAVCAEESGLVQWKPPKKLPASAKNLPGVQAFQALRRTDVVLLAHCAADTSLCPPELLVQLHDVSKHEGILVLNDAILVFFCRHSPMASALQVCRDHPTTNMVARLQQYKDDEYRNDDLISCVKSDLAQCAPKFKLQLDRLTDRPEMLVAIQHILKFMCQGRAGSRLAVCVPDAAVSTPRGQVLQRLKRHKYDVILDRAKKAMFF
jgi:hypothetical protein